jgi:AraC-like DNA-binding protein
VNLATDILRFITIGQILVILGLLIRTGNLLSARATSGFLICIVGYLFADWGQLSDYDIHVIFAGLAFALPFNFWLFSKALFDDQFSWRKWMPLVLLTVLVVDYLIYFQERNGIIDMSGGGMKVLDLVHHGMSLLFVILAIIEAVRSRAADLVISRFRFRSVFISLASIVIVITILSEIAFPVDNEPVALDFFQKFVIAGLTFYFAVNRLQFSPGFFRTSVPPRPDVPTHDNELAEEVVEYIEKHRGYRTEGLTIRELAIQMNVQEYKLRQAINQNLGFRNFNEFLNSYRIDDACKLLADPANRKMTVLEIVYKVGYSSLAPFNRAFKEITGMTPTAWRKEKLR